MRSAFPDPRKYFLVRVPAGLAAICGSHVITIHRINRSFLVCACPCRSQTSIYALIEVPCTRLSPVSAAIRMVHARGHLALIFENTLFAIAESRRFGVNSPDVASLVTAHVATKTENTNKTQLESIYGKRHFCLSHDTTRADRTFGRCSSCVAVHLLCSGCNRWFARLMFNNGRTYSLPTHGSEARPGNKLASDS